MDIFIYVSPANRPSEVVQVDGTYSLVDDNYDFPLQAETVFNVNFGGLFSNLEMFDVYIWPFPEMGVPPNHPF